MNLCPSTTLRIRDSRASLKSDPLKRNLTPDQNNKKYIYRDVPYNQPNLREPE
jgi:hypothetical protein